MIPKPISCEVIEESNSFPNLWARGIGFIRMNGRKITFGDEKDTKYATDVCLTASITGKALEEAISGKFHPKFPTRQKMKDGYIREWDRNFPWKEQGFTYCYQDRAEAYKSHKRVKITLQHPHLHESQVPGIEVENIAPLIIDQWKLAKEDIARQIATQDSNPQVGFPIRVSSNRNVIDIGNVAIDRFDIPDSPPCLRLIQLRFEGIDEDTGIPYVSARWVFRSRDFGMAYPTNITGILAAINREVLQPNHAWLNQVIDVSLSAHVYRGDANLFEEVYMIPTVRM